MDPWFSEEKSIWKHINFALDRLGLLYKGGTEFSHHFEKLVPPLEKAEGVYILLDSVTTPGLHLCVSP